MTICDDYHIRRSRGIELLERELTAKDKRIQELLEANNAYLERARAAEAQLQIITAKARAAIGTYVKDDYRPAMADLRNALIEYDRHRGLIP